MSELVRLSVLESYGVRWSRETFARDIVQNFFDATGDFERLVLTVDRAAGVVEIRGPHAFDLTLLFYVGATTKHDDSTAGGFGEGFKICALVGVRDFGLHMTAGAGDRAFEVIFDAVPRFTPSARLPTGEAQASLGRELCYRWVSHPDDAQGTGSFVRMVGCDAALCDAFEGAPLLFRHARHPDLQRPLALSADGRAGLFLVDGQKPAALFYRRQLRGRVDFNKWDGWQPFHLCFDGAIDGLEGDRDRRDVALEPVARAIGLVLAPDDLFKAIAHLRDRWAWSMNPLNCLVDAAIERGLVWPAAQWAQAGLPDQWLAHGRKGEESQDELAKRQGFKLALRGFGQLGMPRTGEFYVPGLVGRAPTPLEAARAQVVADLYTAFVGKPSHNKRLEVFDDPEKRAAIQGQHFADQILMSAEQLHGPLWKAAETLLHEHAHEAGGDQDEKFWQRLERLLLGALRAPEKLDAAEARYSALDEATVAAEAEAARLEAERKAAEAAAVEAAKAAEEAEVTDGIDPRAVALFKASLWHEWMSAFTAKPRPTHLLRVFTPPGWVPCLAWSTAVQEAAAQRDLRVQVAYEPVYTRKQAEGLGFQGLPTLRIRGVDLPPDVGPDRDDGLGLQSWGGAPLPSVERVVAALAQAPAAQDALDLMRQTVPVRVDLHAQAPAPEKKLPERVAAALAERWQPKSYTSDTDDIVASAHGAIGQAAARQVLAEGEVDFEAAVALATRRTEAAIEVGRRLRHGESTSGSPIETAALAAAEGMAAILAFRGDDAEAGFARVRALYEEMLAIELDYKQKTGPFVLGFDFAALSRRGLPSLEDALQSYTREVETYVRDERASWVVGERMTTQRSRWASVDYTPPTPAEEAERKQRIRDERRRNLLQWHQLVLAFDAGRAAGLDDFALARHLLAVSPDILGEEDGT